MTEIITYSLRTGNKNSDDYYRAISGFCDEFLKQAWQQAPDQLGSFQSWSDLNVSHSLRSRDETAYELLCLGVLWMEHSQAALESKATWRRFFTWLAKLRKQKESLKSGIDLVRGWMGWLLSPRNKRIASHAHATLQNMQILLDWLQASGEYAEMVERLRAWSEFLAQLSPQDRARVLQAALDLADWFESSSRERLGEYTARVETFLELNLPRYRWREDYLFCGRRPVEYHLNMLGTEILNRSLQSSFEGTPRKVVIIPPCMKAKPEEECQASSTPFGEHCENCTPGCHVNQVTRLGEKYGFDVFIIPDDLKQFSGNKPGSTQPDPIGLVGVSCPLTNAPGGWEMKRLGVPAQGLLLDYCGCTWHWHKDGIPTDLNIHQLLKLVKAQDNQP